MKLDQEVIVFRKLKLFSLGLVLIFFAILPQTPVHSNLLRTRVRNLRRDFSWGLTTTKAFFCDKWLGIETREEGLRREKVITVAENEDTSLNKDMNVYEAMFYGAIQRMTSYLGLSPGDVIIDLGCGKGRVVFVVAQQRLKKVIGVEIDPGLADKAKRNLRTLKRSRSPVEIACADAARYKFTDETVILLCNPFGAVTMGTVLRNIRESWERTPRKVRIVYYNPLEKELLDKQDWLTFAGKMKKDNIWVWST